MTYQPLNLETIKGYLESVINASEPYSRQIASELSLARVRAYQNNDVGLERELATSGFYVANVLLFKKDGNRLLYGIGGRNAFNFVFGQNNKDTDASILKLRQNGFYQLTSAKNLEILSLEGSDVDFVDSKELKASGKKEFQSILIRTRKYNSDITPAREPFVRAAYASGEARKIIMGYLADNQFNDVSETRVWVPNPDVVGQALTNLKDGEMLARACYLSCFRGSSDFGTLVGFAGYSGALRGVRRSDVPDESTYAKAVQRVALQ